MQSIQKSAIPSNFPGPLLPLNAYCWFHLHSDKKQSMTIWHNLEGKTHILSKVSLFVWLSKWHDVCLDEYKYEKQIDMDQ